MRILFNATGCGLGNNGGTRTIVRSAEALQALGHEVIIQARRNGYTWHQHDVPVRANVDSVWDVAVRVSVWDDKLHAQAKRQVWWLRGWERWVYGDLALKQRLKEWAARHSIMCNAAHLCAGLAEVGIESRLCYAGLDLDFWGDQCRPRTTMVGGVVNHRHRTKRSDLVITLCDAWLEGDHGALEVREFYNGCRIWLAPSELEGFHQCPAEAALCGALVVGYSGPHSGTGDWLDNTTGHVFSTVAEARAAISKPDYSRIDKAQQVLREQIGDRARNMCRFVELCSD